MLATADAEELDLRGAARAAAKHIIKLGCLHGVPQSSIDKCLPRMPNFTGMANEVLEAELPNSDLFRAFCLFNLATHGGGLAPGNTADGMP